MYRKVTVLAERFLTENASFGTYGSKISKVFRGTGMVKDQAALNYSLCSRAGALLEEQLLSARAPAQLLCKQITALYFTVRAQGTVSRIFTNEIYLRQDHKEGGISLFQLLFSQLFLLAPHHLDNFTSVDCLI